MPPFIIAIAGPSGAGKSYLARHLAESLPAAAAILPIDSYYRELTDLTFEERCGFNFDHPDALDRKLLVHQLREIASGHPIDQPIYQFETHSRASECTRFAPPPFVILEGIFALYFPEICAIAKLKVFVDTPDGLCFERRLKRDVLERERSAESVTKLYTETVRPMAYQHVWPTANMADLILPGHQPVAKSMRELLACLPIDSPFAMAAGKG